jgi:hypothetical protein
LSSSVLLANGATNADQSAHEEALGLVDSPRYHAEKCLIGSRVGRASRVSVGGGPRLKGFGQGWTLPG